jgi:hypothetical protein
MYAILLMLLAAVGGGFVITEHASGGFVITDYVSAKPKPAAVKPRHRQIVMISGEHCGPCRRFKEGPLVKLKKTGWTVGLTGHIDIWDEHDPRCKDIQIDGLPMFLLFVGDNEVDDRVGYIDAWEIGRLWNSPKAKLAPTSVLTK